MKQATHLLITRPEIQARRFAGICAATFGARVALTLSPLLVIERLAWPLELAGIRLLLFTSENGVNSFAAVSSRRDIPCLCVGARTAAAARGLGFAARSADGNADDLVALAARSAANAQLLLVRGRHARGDVAARLRARGLIVSEAILYDQVEQPLSAAARGLLDGRGRVIVAHFSPRSAQIFVRQTLGFDLGKVESVCLSAAVAEKLQAAAGAAVHIAARPDQGAMLAAIEMLL